MATYMNAAKIAELEAEWQHTLPHSALHTLLLEIQAAEENATLGNVTAAAAVADLNQDISTTYVEAEVQAISDKVDALLASLRAAGLLAT